MPPPADAPPEPISLFADSGHHFEFVLLSRFEAEPGVDVAQICAADNLTWVTSAEYPWIRYRPGRAGEGPSQVPGFWIALESNVGTEARGLVYEFDYDVPAQPIADERDQSRTPYAYPDVNQIAESPQQLTIEVVDPAGGRKLGMLKLPEIGWTKPNMKAAIDVDLIIDFGNTRTVALVLERRPDADRLDSICRPVRFVRRGTSYRPYGHAGTADDPCAIVDSWIVLHETLFADHEPPSKSFQPRIRGIHGNLPQNAVYRALRRPPKVGVVKKAKYMPQMFVELAPALLGGGNGLDSARQALRDTRHDLGPNSFLSSPKRYAWDGDSMGVGGRPFWNVELNRWNPEKAVVLPNKLPPLQGPMLLFLDDDGRFWDLDRGDPPPNERPRPDDRPQAKGPSTHPRRDSLTWAALAIIEAAYRQINSQAYRSGNQFYAPRRLRQVLVTFPSGWTTEELESYRQQWQKAINIFTLGHFTDRRLVKDGGDRPLLVTDLDEAVASQLPVIYSEGLRVEANAWIDLVGRRRLEGDRSTLRIMNVDIGGGTTDLAIAEYYNALDGADVDLHATLLFRNSNTIAGDSLVKRVIERVLLPELASTFSGEERTKFVQLFHSPPESWRAGEPSLQGKLARIVQLALVPIVHHWLKSMADGKTTAIAPKEMKNASGERVVEEVMVQQLNALAKKFLGQEVLKDSQVLNYDPARVVDCIRDQFEPLFRSYGKLAAAFDCDLVFVSGKPSELPHIRELLRKLLPIAPERIQVAKGFEVGNWYPLSVSNGAITDAKTITVVGAALRQAMTNGLIPGWRLTYEPPESPLSAGNYWGIMPKPGAPEAFWKNLLLEPDQTERTCKVVLGRSIGRMRYRSTRLMPDQIYVLRWRPTATREEKNPTLTVTFRRVNDSNGSELLEVVSADGATDDGRRVTAADVELQLKTLPDDAFWMDNPRFDIEDLDD